MQRTLRFLTPIAAVAGAAWLAGCASVPPAGGPIAKEHFGTATDGAPIDIYTLRNTAGAEARICNYGGIVVSLKVPDREGKLADVVLGYDRLEDYVAASPYFGALIGRYGNRIARGKFELDGRSYTLATNNYPNALHGGVKGFDKRVWHAQATMTPDGPSLELTYVSHDGEEGYPANLSVTAVYTLTDDNALRLQYTAKSDRDTIVNLTHHSYFNLAGQGSGTILNHQVMIPADRFTPVDETLIPTGQLQPVEGTPFDFRNPMPIGARIDQDDQQLKFGNGYDHNWVINKPLGQMGLMAQVYEPTTGRVMEVLSDEPGLQFYSGNFLDGSNVGKGGHVYNFRNGFCMEPQHFPDSPNHPNFPSVVLKAGQVFKNTIIYKFSTR